MANILINTVKLAENAQELDKLACKYNSLVKELFETMDYKINSSWSGDFAESYKKSLLNDKKIFLSYGSYLNSYANYLNEISNSFQIDIMKAEK